MIASYNYAILVHCKEVGSATTIVCEIERRIFLVGYYKAFGLGNGPCRLCSKCNTRGCIHAEQARPSMEDCDIDVYATVRANGYPIEVVEGFLGRRQLLRLGADRVMAVHITLHQTQV